MPRVRHASLAILVLALGAISLRAQPRPDPFDDEFQSPSAKKNLPVVLPDMLPVDVTGLSPTAQKIVEFVDLQASAEPTKVKRGQIVRITVDGTSKPWAYTYSAVKRHPTQSGLASRLNYRNAPWLKPLYPIQETGTDQKPSGKETSFILHGQFHWRQDVYISPDAPLGKQKILVQPFIQVCTKKNEVPKLNEFCFQPTDYRPLPVTFEILDGPAIPPPANLEARAKAPSFGDASGDDQNTPPRFSDLSGLLLGAFVGAILMLLTPCVFPMIPITVNFFIKQSEKEHHRPFFMASIYAGTIVFLLTCVILLAGKSIIDLANDAWFNLGLGVVLILFALGLFGMFEVDLTKFFGTVLLLCIGFGLSYGAKKLIPTLSSGNYELPLAIVAILLAVPVTMLLGKGVRRIESIFGFEESALLNFLAQQESRGGMLGAAFMAMTFTITSFSCTGPFLGIMLAPLAGTSLPKLHLLLAALVYSVTFAAPFFLLALFPSYLKKLPKSGGWMTTIKVTMGFLEIGAALKFLSNTDMLWFPGNPRLFNYDTVLCSWIALCAACSLYLFGLYRLHHDTPDDHIGVPRMIFASIFLGMALYLTPLLFGVAPRGFVMEEMVAFLPPDFERVGAGAKASSAQDAIPWIKHDYAAAWKEAKVEKKLIFIDFTGVNCTNCRENERNVFPRADVIAELKKYVCIKLFTDNVPNAKLTSTESKKEADVNLTFQLGLTKELAQPTYVIIEPDGAQPFDGKHLNARSLGFRTGKIFDVADFVSFLQVPLKDRNAMGRRAVPWIDDDRVVVGW